MKFRTIVLSFLVAMFTALSAFAADNIETRAERPFASSVNLKLDVIKEHGQSALVNEGADFYAVWGKKYGFGVDTTIGDKKFFDVRPYATVAIEGLPLTAIVGYDSVSSGAKYVQYGVWFSPKVGSLNVFLDLRNYSALTGAAYTYLDAFTDLTVPINKTFSAGVDAEIIHQWNGDSDNMFIGPVVYTKIGFTTLMTRFEKEQHWSPGQSHSGYNVRVALKIPFS